MTPTLTPPQTPTPPRWPTLARWACRITGHRPRRTLLSWDQRIIGEGRGWTHREAPGPVLCSRCRAVLEAMDSPLPTARTDGSLSGLPVIDNVVQTWT